MRMDKLVSAVAGLAFLGGSCKLIIPPTGPRATPPSGHGTPRVDRPRGTGLSVPRPAATASRHGCRVRWPDGGVGGFLIRSPPFDGPGRPLRRLAPLHCLAPGSISSGTRDQRHRRVRPAGMSIAWARPCYPRADPSWSQEVSVHTQSQFWQVSETEGEEECSIRDLRNSIEC